MNLKVFVSILTILFFLPQISAICEEGQIDINSASAEELDNIAQIGPARAEQIISLRPFSSVDDMIRINGIGESNINLIKSQGLACVAEEGIEEDNEKNSSNTKGPSNVSAIKIEDSSPKETEFESINLNPKAIKSEENTEVSGKRDYTIYGLLAFGALLGLLFLIKKIAGKKYKNEFT